MKSFRDWIVFLAGFEAFHTITHIVIALSINLPLATKYVNLTSTMNTWAIVINGIVTIGLIWLAKRLGRWKRSASGLGRRVSSSSAS